MTAGAMRLVGCLPSRSPTGRTYAGSLPSRRERSGLLRNAAAEVSAQCKPTTTQKNRTFLTVQRWHVLVVGQNALAPLARAMATKRPRPKMKTSCAATALAVLRGVGPYSANKHHQHAVLARRLGIRPRHCRPRCAGHARLAPGRRQHPAFDGPVAERASPSGAHRPRGCGTACGNGVMPLAGHAARLVPVAALCCCQPESLAR